jgi:hypothetical protein
MISLIYNLDSRPGFLDDCTSAIIGKGGCRHIDFFLPGLQNKIDFLQPHELEIIIYIDKHLEIPHDVLTALEEMLFFREIKHLIIKDHSRERFGKQYGKNNNDLIYAECLAMATGEYVVHFDADTVAYKQKDIDMVDSYIQLLEKYDYVSLPSVHSPNCLDPKNELMNVNYQWASTRFFICKRETLPSFDELVACFDNKYLTKTIGYPARPNCVEHILGAIAGKDKVYYPPVEMEKYLIMSFAIYYAGTIEKLNELNYNKVKKYFTEICQNYIGHYDVCGQTIDKLQEIV